MEVKGTAIAAMPTFIADRFGWDKLDQWLKALPPESRKVYSQQVMVNDWFDLKRIYLDPTELLCELFYGGDRRGAWELGRASAEYGLKGVYRAFVKMTSVKFFIRRANVMLPAYFKPCAMELVSQENNRTVAHMTLFPEPHAIVDNRIAGWMERSLEIHGCRDVKVEVTKSLANQDPVTEFVLTWK